MSDLKNRIFFGLVMISAAALVACSSTPAQTTETTAAEQASETTTVAETQSEQETTAEALKAIGDKADAESQMEIVNNTGTDIVFVSLTLAGTEGGNLLEQGDVFKDSETRTLFIPKAEGDGQSFPEWQLKIAVSGNADAKSTLSAFPVGDAEKIQVQYDADHFIPYLLYESKTTGKEVSTLEAEMAIAQAAAEDLSKAAEEASRQAEEEAARANEAAAAYSYDDDSYNAGGYDGGDYEDYDDSGSGNDEDGCIDDDALMF